MILAFVIIGAVFMLVGAVGVYMAMTSPLQLQPIPAILFVIGAGLELIALGSWIA